MSLELSTADYYKFKDVMHQRSLILDRGNPFSVPGGHSRARNRPILARAGILNAVHVLLQLLLQNFYFAAAVAITMAERNVDSDDGEFIATWCIQLLIYVHILLYFFPLLQNSSWNSTTFMGSTKQTFRRLLRTPPSFSSPLARSPPPVAVTSSSSGSGILILAVSVSLSSYSSL